MKPALLVIAGPNGAGKTTVTTRLRAEHWSEGVEYLNPDEIARDRFGDWNAPNAVLQAAAWTVFSSPDKIDFLQRAIDSGYFVRLFFIGTSDPRINASRVAGRVMAGGHTVPVEKIVSRYSKSIGNLSVAIRLAHRVYVYDNSIDGIEAKLLVRTSEGALRKVYGPVPQWIGGAIDGLPKHPAFFDANVELDS